MTFDERSLQAVASALEEHWLGLATNAELELLIASGQRPDFFQKQLEDDGEIRVVLGYDATGDGSNTLIVRTGPPDPKTMEAAAALVLRRLRLRSLLGLPRDDCASRRPNPECFCLTETLDRLTGEGAEPTDKTAVLKAARAIHTRRKPRAWSKVAAKLEPGPRPEPRRPAVPLEPDPPAASLVTQTPTRPEKIRWRQGRRASAGSEELSPRVWLSEKSRRQRGLLDRMF